MPCPTLQYIVLAHIIAKVVHSYANGIPDGNVDHMYYFLVLTAICLLMGHLFLIASHLPIIVLGYKVQLKGFNFEQVDREESS